MKLLDAIEKLLSRENESIHYATLSQRLMSLGVWRPAGSRPAREVHEALFSDIARRGQTSRFLHHGSGVYGLRRPARAARGFRHGYRAVALAVAGPDTLTGGTLPLAAIDRSTRRFDASVGTAASSTGERRSIRGKDHVLPTSVWRTTPFLRALTILEDRDRFTAELERLLPALGYRLLHGGVRWDGARLVGTFGLDRLGVGRGLLWAYQSRGHLTVEHVEEMATAMEGQRVMGGLLVCTSSFHAAAEHAAREAGIVRVDGPRLIELILELDRETRHHEKMPEREAESWRQAPRHAVRLPDVTRS